MKDLYILQKQVSYNELLSFRAIARESLNDLTMLERLKFKLGFSVNALFFTRFLFNKFFLLIEDHKLIGFAIVRLNKLRALFIEPNKKNHGHGKFLLNHVENYLKEKGYQSIYLRPTKKSKTFYNHLGYQSKGYHLVKDL